MAGERVLLADDCMEYFLFPSISTGKSEKTTNEILEDCIEAYLSHLGSYLVDYIWQNEPFSLRPNEGLPDNLPPHIYGRTIFGDNIEDEWFIVFLLNELTKAFPDLVIRVADNDGEFLLIEMAEHLPKWMNPDTTENRVYIHQGSVHVVPIEKTGPLASLGQGIPCMADASVAVRKFPKFTKCDAKCQKTILHRIGGFPDKTKESRHRAHCYLPASVAVLLKHQPSLLAAAVQAFYLRTPSDLKLCRAMKYFPPETRVMTEVVFTRCLYAQLMQQKFSPDKCIGWDLPHPASAKFLAYDLGVKLACGFEILVGTCGRPNSSLNPSSEPEFEARWHKFVQSLDEKGYFKAEVQGSKLHQSLFDRARQFFEDNFSEDSRKEMSTGQRILALLQKVEVDIEALQRQEKELSPPDDDSWLEMTPAQLDSLLQDKVDGGVAKQVASSLKQFVQHTSSYAGAEVPTLRENPNRTKAGRVTLDPDTFADAVQSILDFKLPDWEEGSSSDMSDYSDEDVHDGLGQPSGKAKESEKAMEAMKKYMSSMDQELAGTAVDREANKEPSKTDSSNNVKRTEDDLGNLSPVDVDLSSLQSIMESYRCQQGRSGPVSNMLGTMGIELHPQNQ